MNLQIYQRSIDFRAKKMKTLPVVVMTSKTILLIYKDPNVREVVQAYLTDLGGWNVRVANSTSEGLRQARLYQPDAIIWGNSLTEIDEMFLKQIRAEPATQKIPIVILRIGSKWFDFQILERYQVAAVIVDLLDPTMLTVKIANMLGWHIDFKSDRTQER